MTSAFGGQRSIQLSYGCVGRQIGASGLAGKECAERLVQLSPSPPDDHPDVAGGDDNSLAFRRTFGRHDPVLARDKVNCPHRRPFTYGLAANSPIA